MKFSDIHIHNFFSVEDASFSLGKQGLILLKGENLDSDSANSNGSGKSTLAVDAWCWVLFGKTARGVAGSKVVKRGSTDGCWGKVQFEKAGYTFQVIRYQDHPDEKNNLKLFCDKNDISKTDKREVQKQIEETLGFSMQLGLNCMVLGQSGIAFASMTDAQKKQIFEKILGFDKFVVAQQRAKDKVKELDGQIVGKKQIIFSYEQQIESLNRQLKLQIDQSETWEKDQLKKKVEVEEYITGCEQRLVELRTEVDNLDLLALVKELEETEADEEAKGKLASEWASYIDALNAQLRNLGNEQLLEQLATQAGQAFRAAEERNDRSVNRAREFLSNLKQQQITTVCPTCEQALPIHQIAVAKQNLADQIGKAEVELKQIREAALQEATSYSNAYDDAIGKLETFRSSTVQLRENLEKAKPQHENAKQIHNLACNKRDEVRRQLKCNQDLKAEKEFGLQQLEQQIGVAKARLEVKQTNPYTIAIDSTQQSLDSVTRDLSAQLTELGKIEERQKLYQFWVVGFGKSGIQSYMLDSFTPFLNEKIAEYAEILFNGEVDIHFQTQRLLADGETLKEDFHVSVDNKLGADSYDGNSGGEKERVDICIAFGMQDLVISRQGTEFNLCVLDEVAKYIDECGVERYYNLLRHVAQSRETILVVTHSPYLEAWFDKIWIVTKKNGTSTLVA